MKAAYFGNVPTGGLTLSGWLPKTTLRCRAIYASPGGLLINDSRESKTQLTGAVGYQVAITSISTN